MLGVYGPSFDVGRVAVDHTEQSAPLRSHAIRVLTLDGVARHRFVNADLEELVLVVLTHLGFRLLVAPAWRDRSYPVESGEIGLERGREHRAGDSVDPAHEQRRRNH